MLRRDFAGGHWRKSSYSAAQTQCVELAKLDHRIGVRDSKKGEASPVLEFTAVQFAIFVAEAKAGEFDALP